MKTKKIKVLFSLLLSLSILACSFSSFAYYYDDHGNDPSEATYMGGGMVYGQFNYNGDVDYFIFMPQESGYYEFKTSGSVPSNCEVYYGTTQQIASGGGSLTAYLHTGVYYYIKLSTPIDVENMGYTPAEYYLEVIKA